MPTAQYTAYVSNSTLMAEVEEYISENDMGESEFIKEAMAEKIEREREIQL